MLFLYTHDNTSIHNYSTLTSHSSIFQVACITTDSGAAGAVHEVALTTTAMNIVQVDWANTSTKVSIAEGNCTYS